VNKKIRHPVAIKHGAIEDRRRTFGDVFRKPLCGRFTQRRIGVDADCQVVFDVVTRDGSRRGEVNAKPLAPRDWHDETPIQTERRNQEMAMK
jgi:hypothetical protein